jgi:hypothetical protein
MLRNMSEIIQVFICCVDVVEVTCLTFSEPAPDDAPYPATAAGSLSDKDIIIKASDVRLNCVRALRQ